MAVVKFMERYLNSKVSGESDIIPGTSFKKSGGNSRLLVAEMKARL